MCVERKSLVLDHLSKPRQLLHHLRVIMSLQRWIDCCFVIKFLPRKDFQKVRSFVSLPVRGACNVKEFTWLQLSIIQLFFNYVVRTPRNNASRDRCHEKFRHVCNSVISVLTKLGKAFYQNLLRCKKKRKEGKSRWGKKKRCMLPLFCWGDSIWGHFTFHRLPAVPVFFAKEEKCSVWFLKQTHHHLFHLPDISKC